MLYRKNVIVQSFIQTVCFCTSKKHKTVSFLKPRRVQGSCDTRSTTNTDSQRSCKIVVCCLHRPEDVLACADVVWIKCIKLWLLLIMCWRQMCGLEVTKSWMISSSHILKASQHHISELLMHSQDLCNQTWHTSQESQGSYPSYIILWCHLTSTPNLANTNL